MSTRIEKLRARMEELKLPGVLVLHGENVRYLSGFSGSTAGLLVTPDRALFVTDSRYDEQAREECPTCEIVRKEQDDTYADAYGKAIREAGLDRAAFEAEYVTVAALAALRKKLKGVKLIPRFDLITPLRYVKDDQEVALIRQACLLVDRGFEFLLTRLRPGLRERDLAVELEYFLRKHGSEREAFDIIVASGERSALPHGRASEKPIAKGDFITFDFGACVNGYYSDITRTVVLGQASERQRQVYDVVLTAQLAALKAIRAGVPGKDVDETARQIIRGAGYGDNFGHGLGHGLGRSVHDHQALSPQSKVTLAAGMVVTVEPGVYLPGWGGVRIEDDVLVTAEGCRILTHSPKELIEVSAG
jgi:Xaa-Pro aminopeptidase